MTFFHGQRSSTTINNNTLKIFLICLLVLLTFLATCASLALPRILSRHRFAFSLISCFGAGVFLGTCLLHLLPDAAESISKARILYGTRENFPLAELSLSLGFLFVLLLEQGIIYASEQNWFGLGTFEIGERLLGHHHRGYQSSYSQSIRWHNHNDAPVGDTDADGRSVHTTAISSTYDADEPHSFNDRDYFHTSTIRALILVFALSLHAIFEGFSIGTIDDDLTLVQIFAALTIHKCIVGFSLGLRLVQSSLKRRTVLLCCGLFSVQILIGGIVAIVITNLISTYKLTCLLAGVLTAIAAGTFLYVTTFEILPQELIAQPQINSNSRRPYKMLSLIFGFAVIASFVAIFPDTDGHKPPQSFPFKLHPFNINFY